MSALQTKPLSWFKVNPQVRKTFSEQELRQLGESLKVKQLQPVLAQPDGTLIAGERRYRAAKLVGLASLEVILTDRLLSDSEIRLIQLTENLQRADLTGYEKWIGCSELLSINEGWTQKDLAAHLHLSEAMIVRYISPSRCIQDWQDALREGKVGISDCYAASKMPEADQAGLLALKLSGASRDQIEQAGRKSRKEKAPAVRMSKVKVETPSGATVTIAGDDLSMSEVVELLSEVLKEAKKAAETFDVKTWVKMMADKAKAA